MTDMSKEQIRRRMLLAAKDFKGRPDCRDGFGRGDLFYSVKDDEGNACPTEAEAIDLVGDLVAWGMLVEDGQRVSGGVPMQFRHRRFSITRKAMSWWLGEFSIPGIADA